MSADAVSPNAEDLWEEGFGSEPYDVLLRALYPNAHPDLIRAASFGFRLLTFERGRKGPKRTGWQNEVQPLSEVLNGDDKNYGTVTGHEVASGRFLADVDVDWPDGSDIVEAFLPRTSARFGRSKKPLSHMLYTTPEPVASTTYAGVDGDAMLLELRGTNKDGTLGHQTMIPPSVHPDSETVYWHEKNWEPADVTADELLSGARLAATAMLIAKHWPEKGSRHDLRLAYARVLLDTLKVPDDAAIRILESACKAGGSSDEGVDDAAAAVRSTRAKLDADEPATGGKTVEKLLPDVGAKIVKRLCEWHGVAPFKEKKDGKITANALDKIRLALKGLGVDMSQDVFAEKKLVTRNGKTEPLQDDVYKGLWVEVNDQFHFRPSMGDFLTVLETEAAKHWFHPVRDYLNGLKWDQQPRIDRWLVKYGRAADTELTRTVGAMVLIAAVRRVRKPGCKFDEMLVLESGQGWGKSEALAAICPNKAWFTDNVPLNLDAKRMIEATLGIWIAEVADLASFSSAKVDHLKAMLSRGTDGPARMAYARLAVTRAREFIVIGTTNDQKYLADPTGGRRFWPIRVGHFDVAGLAGDRDQLWAEAAVREAAGESIRLPEHLWDAAAIQQEMRREEDPWEDILEGRFGDENAGARISLEEPWVALGQMATDAKEAIPVERRGPREQQRVTRIMTRLGFVKKNARTKDGKQAKQWCKDLVQTHLDEDLDEGGA